METPSKGFLKRTPRVGTRSKRRNDSISNDRLCTMTAYNDFNNDLLDNDRWTMIAEQRLRDLDRIG